MNKQPPVSWYIVTAEHMNGYAITHRTRSAKTAAKLHADLSTCSEVKPGTIKTVVPEIASRQTAYLAGVRS